MKMFDLNMEESTSNNLGCDDGGKDDKLVAIDEASVTNTELSGTSSASSIFNADESLISDTTTAIANEYDFFVSRAIAEPSPSYITRQLFPDDDDHKLNESGGSEPRATESLRLGYVHLAQNNTTATTSNNNQWLNLSMAGSGSGPGPGPSQVGDNKQQVRRSRRGPRSRSSQYRGVTFYRRTGRWESHIWDSGKQVYLGGFDTAHAAARAYDRAAIKFRGVDADINFNITDYDDDMKQMKNLSKTEFVHILRRQSTGFARGTSRYRGVVLHKCGRWEARMGQFLGTMAYDKPPLQCSGRETVTNFELGSYQGQQPMRGDGHDLDLNLGISVTIDGPKVSNNMGVVGESLTPQSPLQLGNGKKPMNGTCNYYPPGAFPLYGQPLTSGQTSTKWSGLPPGRSTPYEEKVNEQKLEAMSSARISNWAWYMQNQGHQGGNAGGTASLNQVPQLSSAASSGFPFSTATTASLTTLFATSQSNQTNHALMFHPTPTPSTNNNNNSFHPYGQGRS